ncbi:hypothetical protein QTP88_012488 [Uroleucon formosanum]
MALEKELRIIVGFSDLILLLCKKRICGVRNPPNYRVFENVINSKIKRCLVITISRKIRISPLPPIFWLWQRCAAAAALPDRMIKQKKSMHSSAAAVDWSYRLYVATDQRRRRYRVVSRTCDLCTVRRSGPISIYFLRARRSRVPTGGGVVSLRVCWWSVVVVLLKSHRKIVTDDRRHHYYAFGFRPTKPTGSPQRMTTTGGRRSAKNPTNHHRQHHPLGDLVVLQLTRLDYTSYISFTSPPPSHDSKTTITTAPDHFISIPPIATVLILPLLSRDRRYLCEFRLSVYSSMITT